MGGKDSPERLCRQPRKLLRFSSSSPPPPQSCLSLEAARRDAHSISRSKLSLSRDTASPGPFLLASPDSGVQKAPTCTAKLGRQWPGPIGLLPGLLGAGPGLPGPEYLGVHQGSTGASRPTMPIGGWLPAPLFVVPPGGHRIPLSLAVPFLLLFPGSHSPDLIPRRGSSQEGGHFRQRVGLGGYWERGSPPLWGPPHRDFCSPWAGGLGISWGPGLLLPPLLGQAALPLPGRPQPCSGPHWVTTPVSHPAPLPPSLGAPSLSSPVRGALRHVMRWVDHLSLTRHRWGGDPQAVRGSSGPGWGAGCREFGQSRLGSGVSCTSARVLWC